MSECIVPDARRILFSVKSDVKKESARPAKTAEQNLGRPVVGGREEEIQGARPLHRSGKSEGHRAASGDTPARSVLLNPRAGIWSRAIIAVAHKILIFALRFSRPENSTGIPATIISIGSIQSGPQRNSSPGLSGSGGRSICPHAVRNLELAPKVF